MKKVTAVHNTPEGHWVGDGFPVRTLFSYDRLGGEAISPFLLLDYAGPAEFEPADNPRGVWEHPHRGFETVTIVYQGELEHRDSTGSGGRIGRGDVQWMTAASGIIHEEFHSAEFTRKGGTLEMVQLWVNLPAKDKLSKPRYQTILDTDIPATGLQNNSGELRVIAGEYRGLNGPAQTFTPMNVWDLHLREGSFLFLPLQEGHNAILVVLHGTITINQSRALRGAELAILDRNGSGVHVESHKDCTLLVLTGEPIAEPVVGHGPFVMNSVGEIEQAIADYRNGRFGNISQ